MPELINIPRAISLVYDIQHSSALIRDIVLDHNEEFIGRGAECVVIGNSTEKVTALDYSEIQDPLISRKLFYWQRIYSILFPHNFPKFYLSFGGEISGTVREKIISDDSNVEYPFKRVVAICSQNHFPLRFDTATPKNFIVSNSGEYYIDRIILPQTQVGKANNKWNMEEVTRYMNANNVYSPDDIKMVELSIKRLDELDKE